MCEDLVVIGSQGLIGQKIITSLSTKYNILKLDKNPCKDSIVFDPIQYDNWHKLSDKVLNAKNIINCAYPKTETYGLNIEDAEFTDIVENLTMQCSINISILKFLLHRYKKDKTPTCFINIGSVYGHILPNFELYENQKFSMPIEYGIVKNSIKYMNQYVLKLVGGPDFRLNSISPGGVYNNHDAEFERGYALKTINVEMMSGDDLISAIEFLLDPRSRKVNGVDLLIDDGFSI